MRVCLWVGSVCLAVVIAVEGAVADGFGYVADCDRAIGSCCHSLGIGWRVGSGKKGGVVEVGYGTGYTQDTVEGTG